MVNNIDNTQFVGSDQEYLPPLWKGSEITYYPGWSWSKQTGLSRYVFSYEKDTFKYVATRQGQRNGGIDSDNPYISFNIGAPLNAPSFSDGAVFSYVSSTLWQQSIDNKMQYNAGAQSWEWYVRPPQNAAPVPYPFALSAYSGTTTNPLPDTGTIDQVDWFLNYRTPGEPAQAIMSPQFTFNNNSLAGLNSWPIKNTDASYNNEGRPKCITDDLLFKCFQGIPIKPYEIVFIEVMWRKYKNAGIREENSYGFGYGPRSVTTIPTGEWFTPNPVTILDQKGLIYRIGKLEKDSGVDKYDKVTFAQRTRVLTHGGSRARYGREYYDTGGALSPIRS